MEKMLRCVIVIDVAQSVTEDRKIPTTMTSFAILLALAILSGEADPLVGRDLKCLSDAVYWETRGADSQGARLVADVVLNRVEHEEFPDSVCAVVHQPHQFAAGVAENRPILEPRAYEESVDVALDAYIDDERDHEALFFINASIGVPSWARGLAVVTRVGDHVFMTMQ